MRHSLSPQYPSIGRLHCTSAPSQSDTPRLVPNIHFTCPRALQDNWPDTEAADTWSRCCNRRYLASQKSSPPASSTWLPQQPTQRRQRKDRPAAHSRALCLPFRTGCHARATYRLPGPLPPKSPTRVLSPKLSRIRSLWWSKLPTFSSQCQAAKRLR
jgi:hypothetical protein